MKKKIVFLVLLFLPIIGFTQIKQKQRFVPFQNKEIRNLDFTEVLALCKLEASQDSGYYECKIFNVCNGPEDPQAGYCNCSINYYISIMTTELPTKYKLFKVGPFYEVNATYLEKGETENTFTLLIKHNRDQKKLNSKFLINFNKITSLKN